MTFSNFYKLILTIAFGTLSGKFQSHCPSVDLKFLNKSYLKMQPLVLPPPSNISEQAHPNLSGLSGAAVSFLPSLLTCNIVFLDIAQIHPIHIPEVVRPLLHLQLSLGFFWLFPQPALQASWSLFCFSNLSKTRLTCPFSQHVFWTFSVGTF